jgi:hypothetical protein
MTVRPPWRWLTALLLLVNAGVHIPLVPEHLDEAPYIGVLFILLSVACIVLAVVIVVVDTTWVWAASGTISLLALVAFVLSRTVGLPQIGDDVGNWTDPLGFPALASEALTVALAAGALRRRAAAPACA